MIRPGLQHVSPEHLPLGDGRFVQLARPLGKGALSVVHRASLVGLGGVERPVAVKLFAPTASDEREAVHAAIRGTLRRAACVHHPNVVGTFDFALFGAQAFAVQELVDGPSLDALVTQLAPRGRRLPLDIAVFVAVEAVEGVHGARVARDPATGRPAAVVHLGLTPREILLSRHGEVKVADFGMSMVRGATSGVRDLASLARRARWMSPEVARGDGGDERSDVFSLGVMLRELLVGPRFDAATSATEAVMLAREGFLMPLTFQPQLPEELLSILHRALEVEPDHRFLNATALLFELRRVALALGVGDARFFLRRMLEREVRDAFEDTTVQTDVAEVVELPCPPEDAESDAGGSADVVDLGALRAARAAPRP
jgi:serine/threonine-protein kinase